MSDRKAQTTLFGSTVEKEKEIDGFIDLLAAIFERPTSTLLEYDDGSSSKDLHGRAVMERMIRLMKATKEGDTPKQAREKVMKLTDAEKLVILSNASLEAPLTHDAFEEMQRLFLKVKGEEAYKMVFGDEKPRPPPLYDIWKGK